MECLIFGITKTSPFGEVFVGATAGIRTQDLGLKRPLLYQLSYRRKSLICARSIEKDAPTVNRRTGGEFRLSRGGGGRDDIQGCVHQKR
jgi:hypothetical protein